MALSLILTIKISSDSSEDIMLIKDLKSKEEIKFGSNTYNMILKDISFMKKMYEPGSITADFQFKIDGLSWVTISKGALETKFKNKEVTLRYGDASQDANNKWVIKDDFTVCSGYYIHEVHPLYKTDALFATFVMYSVDKQLTLTKGCNSFIGKRLGRDILDNDKNNINFKLPYDTEQLVSYDYSNMKHLCVDADHKETLFPYLVQYNESYYDFLARTCNRWGEFLYFEDGKLNIGYGTGEKDVDTYSTYNYCDLNGKDTLTNSISNYATGALYDKHMVDNNLEKGAYEDATPSADTTSTKILGKLLTSGKNAYDFLFDTLVEEGVARIQAENKASNNNDKFDKEYFSKDTSLAEVKARFNSAKDKCNEFSDFTPHFTSDLYEQVVKGEFDAAQDAVCINLDTTLQDLKLGKIITINSGSEKYIVVQVNTIEKEDLVIDFANKKKKTVKTTTFQVIATKQNSDSYFYPTMLPAGHIRTSGPQRAKIIEASTEDPTKQGRVKVKFPWQGDGTSGETPWLEYTHPGGKGTGTYNRHYKDEEVLVAFANGNVERPYIVGSLSTEGQSAPGSITSNDIVHVTPGGQTIKMNDGTGAGMTAWFANMSPSYKMIQGFFPGASALNATDEEIQKSDEATDDKDKLSEFWTKKKNLSFEGGIELCDKYGMYSIKGSTDGRNVSIKSPFGDIKLNAFTGITISAPNGDVKIQGKNVTIEAGNNLTLTSGKNIKDKFYASTTFDNDSPAHVAANIGLSVGAAIAKKVANMIGGFVDLSIIRHTLEVFVRPVEGKLTVKSNRYLSLEAGKGKTSYPIDTYKADWKHWDLPNINSSVQGNQNIAIKNDFSKVSAMVDTIFDQFKGRYGNAVTAKGNMLTVIGESTNNTDLPCNDVAQIINALWANPDDDIMTAIGFKNMLAADSKDKVTPQQIQFYVTKYPGMNVADENEKKGYVFDRIDIGRALIIEHVTTIRDVIKDLTNFSITDRISGDFSKTGKEALSKDELIGQSTLKTILQDAGFKAFTTAADNLFNDNDKKALRRKFFIELVNTYDFKRKENATDITTKTVAAEPNPFDANITDQQWTDYVNTIQSMPKAKIEFGPGKFFQDNMFDPIMKQIGMLEMACGFHDNLAFGSNKTGKILFSNGGDTLTLDKEIVRVNTDSTDDDAITKAQDIRGFMTA